MEEELHASTQTLQDVGKDLVQPLDLEKAGRSAGYTLDADVVENSRDLRLARNGHTVLIPQPSDSPLDPLNWSWYKKYLVLFVISACAFLPDYGAASGGVVLLTQSKSVTVLSLGELRL